MIVFALENLRKKPKDAAFFAFSIMVTTILIMIFFCILNNPYFGTGTMQESVVETGVYWNFMDLLEGGIGSGIFSVLLSVLLIGICIMTIFFSNSFFLMSKMKDIGIMMISGCTIPRIAKFLVIQNFVVILLVAPIGTLLGYLMSPIVNALIYAQLGLETSLWIPAQSSVGATMITMLLVCVWLVIVNAGFVYRFDSIERLLKARTQMQARNHKPLWKLCSYVAIYGIALYFTIAFPVKDVNVILMYYVGAFIYFGAVNVFRYVLPEVIAWIQRKFFSAHRHFLLSLGNLQYALASARQLVTIILLAAALLLHYLCKFYDEPATFTVVLFTYVVVLILDVVCIVYKMVVDAISKEAIFARMIGIGYAIKDIRKIIRQEVIGFFGCMLLVSLPQMGLILYMYVDARIIPLIFLISVLVSFILALLIGGIITIRLYESIILRMHMQGHMEHE